MEWGNGSVSGILITLLGVVLSASSLADVYFGLRPEAVWAAATSAAALAILLDTNVSKEDCLLVSISSISIGCSISKPLEPDASVTLVECDVTAVDAEETV